MAIMLSVKYGTLNEIKGRENYEVRDEVIAFTSRGATAALKPQQ